MALIIRAALEITFCYAETAVVDNTHSLHIICEKLLGLAFRPTKFMEGL